MIFYAAVKRSFASLERQKLNGYDYQQMKRQMKKFKKKISKDLFFFKKSVKIAKQKFWNKISCIIKKL